MSNLQEDKRESTLQKFATNSVATIKSNAVLLTTAIREAADGLHQSTSRAVNRLLQSKPLAPLAKIEHSANNNDEVTLNSSIPDTKPTTSDNHAVDFKSEQEHFQRW